MINTLINKRYLIKEKIATGGFCDIYRASDIYDEYFNNTVDIVLKIPKQEFLLKDDIQEFIYMEYKNLRKLSNDNIVKVFDFGIDIELNIPYLVLEYLNGELLSDIKDSLDKSQKDKIIDDLKRTIRYIHNKNIIHSDLSLRNIMIISNEAIIFDFGVSFNIKDNLKLDYRTNIYLNNTYSSENIKSGRIPSFECDNYSLSLIIEELYKR